MKPAPKPSSSTRNSANGATSAVRGLSVVTCNPFEPPAAPRRWSPTLQPSGKPPTCSPVTPTASTPSRSSPANGVLGCCPDMAEAAVHIEDFAKMLTQLESRRLPDWIESVQASTDYSARRIRPQSA